jgi:uncharacterized protein YkwD
VWKRNSGDFLPGFRKISHPVILKIMKTLFAFILLFTLGCDKHTPAADSVPGSTTESQTPDPVTASWTDQFMELVNDHRAGLGLRALIIEDGLNEVVSKHSQGMASGSVSFGHTGFSGRCSESYSVLGGGNWCGENVAMGQKSPQAAFTSWMNSPGHRANIESSKATHTGFAYAKSSSGTFYWTQIFIQDT